MGRGTPTWDPRPTSETPSPPRGTPTPHPRPTSETPPPPRGTPPPHPRPTAETPPPRTTPTPTPHPPTPAPKPPRTMATTRRNDQYYYVSRLKPNQGSKTFKFRYHAIIPIRIKHFPVEQNSYSGSFWINKL